MDASNKRKKEHTEIDSTHSRSIPSMNYSYNYSSKSLIVLMVLQLRCPIILCILGQPTRPATTVAHLAQALNYIKGFPHWGKLPVFVLSCSGSLTFLSDFYLRICWTYSDKYFQHNIVSWYKRDILNLDQDSFPCNLVSNVRGSHLKKALQG